MLAVVAEQRRATRAAALRDPRWRGAHVTQHWSGKRTDSAATTRSPGRSTRSHAARKPSASVGSTVRHASASARSAHSQTGRRPADHPAAAQPAGLRRPDLDHGRALLRMLARVMPRVELQANRRPMPWDAIAWEPRIHLGLFVHRVDGSSPGCTCLSATRPSWTR